MSVLKAHAYWFLFPLTVLCIISDWWLPLFVVLGIGSIPAIAGVVCLFFGFLEVGWKLLQRWYENYTTKPQPNHALVADIHRHNIFIISPDGVIDNQCNDEKLARFSNGVKYYSTHSVCIATMKDKITKIANVFSTWIDFSDDKEKVHLDMNHWYHKFTNPYDWHYLIQNSNQPIQQSREEMERLHDEFCTRDRYVPFTRLFLDRLDHESGHKLVRTMQGSPT